MWAKPGVLGGKGPQNIETRLNYDTLSLYQEVAAGNFALFVNAPYVGVDPDNNPGHSNFGDVDLGTKTLLIDCELMQLELPVPHLHPGRASPATASAPGTRPWSRRCSPASS